MEHFFYTSATLSLDDVISHQEDPHLPDCLIENSSKERPHSNTPDDYCMQIPEKKRRLTPDQVNLLEQNFLPEHKLEPKRKAELAKILGLSPRQVAVWFQNRRARWKTKQVGKDYDILKSSYDILLSNFESIAKENDKLKSEVDSLTKKLKDKEATVVEREDPFSWLLL